MRGLTIYPCSKNLSYSSIVIILVLSFSSTSWKMFYIIPQQQSYTYHILLIAVAGGILILHSPSLCPYACKWNCVCLSYFTSLLDPQFIGNCTKCVLCSINHKSQDLNYVPCELVKIKGLKMPLCCVICACDICPAEKQQIMSANWNGPKIPSIWKWFYNNTWMINISQSPTQLHCNI